MRPALVPALAMLLRADEGSRRKLVTGVGRHVAVAVDDVTTTLAVTRLKHEFRALHRAVKAATRTSALPIEGGVFGPDAALIAALMSTGPYGASAAARIALRSEAALRSFAASGVTADLLRLWRPPVPTALAHLAVAVTVDEIVPQMRIKLPALSIALVDRIRDAHWRRDRVLDGNEVVVDGHDVAGTFDVRVSPDVIGSLMRATRTLTGHRLLRWLLAVGQRRGLLGIPGDPRLIVVRGGFSGFARRIGASGNKAADEVEDALMAMQMLQLRLAKGFIGGLLTFEVRQSRERELRIVLGEPLMPGWNADQPKGTGRRREERLLVPIPLRLPPMLGRPRDHAALAVLQIEVMTELRRHAADLVANGGVEVAWSELADCAEVPQAMRNEVRRRWLQPGADQFLADAGHGRLSLGPVYAAELGMLQRAGQKALAGRQARAKRHSPR